MHNNRPVAKPLRYFLLIIILGHSLSSFGQDYKARIDAFRKSYENDFLTDANSPLHKDDLPFLRFYDADSSYRITAAVKYLSGEPVFIMHTFNGASQQYVRYALLNFTLNGKELQLTVYRSIALSNISAYKDYLFLPFTDHTNGNTTYGGGRYIDLNTADFKGATMILDFNKAYNPYCAFSGKYSCPKPPSENNLAVAVEAGEKLFAKKVNH